MQTTIPGNNGWPPPSPPVNDPLIMLGLLLGRTEHLLHWTERVDTRLAAGDQRMTDLAHDIAILKRRPPPKAPEPVPGWEIAIKRPLPWIIGGMALALTGKIDLAIKLMEALAKFAAALH